MELEEFNNKFYALWHDAINDQLELALFEEDENIKVDELIKDARDFLINKLKSEGIKELAINLND